MDEEQLEEIRNNLLKMREEVLEESEKAYAASQSLGKDGVPDIGDMSSNSYNQEVLIDRNDISMNSRFYVHPALYSYFKVNVIDQLPEE